MREKLEAAFPVGVSYRLTWEDVYSLFPEASVSREEIKKHLKELGFRRMAIRKDGDVTRGFGRDPVSEVAEIVNDNSFDSDKSIQNQPFPIGVKHRLSWEEITAVLGSGDLTGKLKELGFRRIAIRRGTVVFRGFGREADWIPGKIPLEFPYDKKIRLTWDEIYALLPASMHGRAFREKIEEHLKRKGFKRMTVRRGAGCFHGFGLDPLKEDPTDIL